MQHSLPPGSAAHAAGERRGAGAAPDLDWRVRIAGLGRYLPRRCVDSAQIEDRVDLPRGWALENSGVEFRHWA